ncbi:MAG: transporter [Comamonadaceae bacterium 32-67-11]|nr:MAG: transporter [Comamonadaceae bacterium 32-67-11]OZA90422.1 MAG: transporter [Burkholderiales bacterium 34-67-9]
MKFWSIFLALMLALTSFDAFAQKRFGGGGSFGQQSGNVQRNATPAQPAQAPGQRAGQATPNQAPASRPWGAMLGGLAAGLGLAWLASSLGLGEEFATLLLFLLAGLAIMVVVGLILRARAASAGRSPFALQGAGGQYTARSYQPGNVGNDASARPWERSQSGFGGSPAPTHGGGNQGGSQGGSLIGSALGGSALGGSQSWGVPADFDTEGFLRASKANFVRIQEAWDRADIAALRTLMSDEMVGHIQAQLAERAAERERAGAPLAQKNEVLMLEAQLLGIEDRGHDYMASVEFSGMMREEGSAGPTPMREVWNITRPKQGPGGWVVAGVQAMH